MNQPRNNHDSNPYESAQQTTPQNPQLDATPNATQAPEPQSAYPTSETGSGSDSDISRAFTVLPVVCKIR